MTSVYPLSKGMPIALATRPMSRIHTKFLGTVEYAPESVFVFPSGLPGFEDQREFLFLALPEREPLIFLQSLTTRNLCFVLLPILTLAPKFQLELTPEELGELRLPLDKQPVIGREILCGALICTGADEALCANLMAPVVVNLKNRLGLQAIHPETGFSHRHAIAIEEPTFAC